MPVRFDEPVDKRLERFDRQGIRCDGNSRHCVGVAVVELDVIRLNPDGKPATGETEHKRSCGRHLIQFDQGSAWEVVGRRTISRPPRQRRPA